MNMSFCRVFFLFFFFFFLGGGGGGGEDFFVWTEDILQKKMVI